MTTQEKLTAIYEYACEVKAFVIENKKKFNGGHTKTGMTDVYLDDTFNNDYVVVTFNLHKEYIEFTWCFNDYAPDVKFTTMEMLADISLNIVLSKIKNKEYDGIFQLED